jgi:hypothetical protein
MDILKQLENAKHQISLVGEDLEHYQDALDEAINIVKPYMTKDEKQIDIIENIKQLLAESEKYSDDAAAGYDEGWYNGEINAYSKVLDIIEKTRNNNVTKEDKNNDFYYSKNLYTVTYKNIQGYRYSQRFNTDYELSNFCNHKLSKNINGEIIKLTNTDKITSITRQTELVLQRDELKNYLQDIKNSQTNEIDSSDYERD